MATIKKGALVFATIRQANGGSKDRPAVVISEGASGVEVVYGEGKAWPGCSCPVEVKKLSLLGKHLHLSKDTYFSDMQVVRHADIIKVFPEECLPTRLPKFEAVAVEARVRIARSSRPQTSLPLPAVQSGIDGLPGDDSSG